MAILINMVILTILISDAEFDDIRSNLNDVMETFFRKGDTGTTACTYKKDTNQLKRFNRDRGLTRNYQDIPVKILVVWDSDGTGAMNTIDRNGSVDISKGYFLIAYDAAETAGIVDSNQNILISTPQDLIIIDTVDYEITGVNLMGQLRDKYCLLKFHIAKRTKPQ